MSKEIEERVVQMKFDNQDFEKHASQSMSTLDKLKNKLNMKGASEGLSAVAGAIKKISFDPIAAGAEKVNAKVVAMESVIFTACQRITNSVIDTGKNLVNMFAIAPVTSGLQEYETQLNAIQTILANTSSKGTTLDDVNAALNELNHYADLTIYNFTEMTRNIGTFTAAGIGLEESTKAIKGIANLAAVSGSTSQQASTAMYQLSQALATGTVKLMDWNSVVNAGMGGEVFKNAILETARVHGIAVDQIIEEEGSFRDSLQKGWLTSEVLIETLENFTLEQTEYNKQMLISKGYTEAQADAILKMAVTATNAATKVKTFSQLMDTLGEAAQSGWTQTWQLILGDFEEAKEFFTYLSDTFSDIINGSADARNNLLEGALSARTVTEEDWNNLKLSGDITEQFQQQLIATAKAHGIAVDEMIETEGGFVASLKKRWLTFDILKETLAKFTGEADAATATATASLEHLEEVAGRVIRGDFGNGEERKAALAEIGEDYASVQAMVNHLLLDTELNIDNLSDAQLQNMGYTQEQINALRELAEQAKATGTPIGDLMADMQKPTGRELLIDSLKITIQQTIKFVKALKKAWRDVFPATTSKQIYNVIEAFHNLLEANQLTEQQNDELIRTFRGVFAVLDILRELMGGSLKIAWNVLNAILESFNTNLLSVTARVGDYFYALRNGIKDNKLLQTATDKVSNALVKAVKATKEWYSQNTVLQNAVAKTKSAIKKAADTTLEWVSSNEGLKKMFETVGHILGDAITAIVDWADSNDILTKAFSNTISFVSESAKYIVDWIDKFRDLPQVQNFMDNFKSSALVAFENITSGARVGKDIIAAFIDKIKEMNGFSFGDLSKTWKGLKVVFKSSFKDMLDLLTGAKISFDGFTGKATESSGIVMTAFNKIKDVAGGFFGYIKNLIDSVSLGDLVLLFTGITTALGGRAILQMIDRVIKIGESFAGVANSMKGAFNATSAALKAYTDNIKSKKILETASAVAILAASIWVLAQIPIKQLAAAVVALGLLGGILAGLSIMAAQLSFNKNFNKTATAIAALTGSILLIAIAVKVMSTMEAKKALTSAGILLGFITVMLIITKLLDRKNQVKIDKSAAAIIAFSVAALVLVKAMEKLAEVSKIANPIATCLMLASVVGSMILISRLAGKMDIKSGIAMIAMATAIKLMVHSLDIVAAMDTKKYLASIGNFLLVIIAMKLMFRTTKSVGDNAAKAGLSIALVSIAFALMVKVIKNIASISPEDIIKGIFTLNAFSIMTALLIASTKLAGENALKAGASILAISVAMIVLAAAMHVMADIDDKAILKSTRAMATLLGMLSVVILASSKAGDAKSTLLATAGAIAVIAGIVILMTFIDSKKLAVATACMAGIMGMLAIIVTCTKNAQKCTGTLALIAVIMGVVGVILIQLAKMDPKNVLATAVSLSLVMAALAGTLLAINKVENIKMTSLGTLAVLAALLYGIGEIFKQLKSLPGDKSLIIKATAISGTLIALAASTRILDKIEKVDNTAMTAVAELAVLLAGIAGVFLAIQDMPGDASLMYKAIAISTVLESLSLATVILSKSSEVNKTAMYAAAELAVLLAGIAGVFWAIQDMPGDESMVIKAGVLTAVLTAIVGLTAILSLVQDVSITAMAAVGVLTLCMAAIAGIFYLVRDMPGDESLVIKATAISQALIAISVCTLALTRASELGDLSSALKGALMFVVVLGVLGVAMAAVCGLTKLAPQLEDWINKGAEVFKAVATGIGEIIGGLFGGIAEGVTSVLPNIGASLSEFAVNGAEFFNLKIDPSAMEGIKSLASAILIITGDQILEKATKWATGGNSMAEFGKSLAGLGEGLQQFSKSIEGIDTENVKKGAEASAALADVATSLPRKDGFAQTILGENIDFDKFGEQLVGYGISLLMYNAAVSGIGDFSAIQASAEASEGLVELANNLPERGGLFQEWFGQNIDFTQFGIELAGYGAALVTYSAAVSGISDYTAIKESAEASEGLVELANNLPERGGLFQEWFGQNIDFTQFGIELAGYGAALVAYNIAVSAIKDFSLINKSVEASQGLVDLANTLPDNTNGTFHNWFFGGSKTNMKDFGAQLEDFGESLCTFNTTLRGVNVKTTADNASCAGTTLANLAKSLPKEAHWYNDVSDLKSFGEQIKAFGGCFKGYADQITDIDMSSVAVSIAEVTSLVEMAKGIEGYDFGAMSSFGSGLKKMGTDGVDSFVKAFTDANTSVKNAGSDMVQQIIEGGNEKSTVAKVFFQGLVNDLVKKISDSKESFKTQAKAIMVWISIGFEDRKELVFNGLKSVINQCYSIIQDSYKQFRAHGEEIFAHFIAGMRTKDRGLPNIFVNALNDTLSSIRNKYSEFYVAGAYLVDGFADGISDNAYKAAAKATAMAAAAATAAKKELDEHSPSKVFYSIGDYAGQGFVNALSDSNDSSYQAGISLATQAKNGLTAAVAGISAMISEDIDTQPTIRPVFDLSDVRTGTKTLNAMLDRTHAVGIGASINETRSGIQNGVNYTHEGLSSGNGNTYNLVQNNYSPKNLSRLDIYRQTNNQFSRLKEVLG